jgi:hypothetical protein
MESADLDATSLSREIGIYGLVPSLIARGFLVSRVEPTGSGLGLCYR